MYILISMLSFFNIALFTEQGHEVLNWKKMSKIQQKKPK